MVVEITESASPMCRKMKEGEFKNTSNVTDHDSSQLTNFPMEEKERKVVKKRRNTTINTQKTTAIFQRQTTFTPLQRIKFNKYVENIIAQTLHKFYCI